jgi:hypothetical protein
MAIDYKEPPSEKPQHAQPLKISDFFDPDRQVTRSFPATYVSAYLVETGGPTVRITFGEGRADVRELVRVAIVMPVEDAVSLAKSIQALLKDEFDKPLDPDKEELVEKPEIAQTHKRKITLEE